MRIVLDTNVLVSGVFFKGAPAPILPVTLPEPVCEDPDDDKFLGCAVASGCSVVVSGDKHLLRVSGYRGVKVLKAREFLQLYLEE